MIDRDSGLLRVFLFGSSLTAIAFVTVACGKGNPDCVAKLKAADKAASEVGTDGDYRETFAKTILADKDACAGHVPQSVWWTFRVLGSDGVQLDATTKEALKVEWPEVCPGGNELLAEELPISDMTSRAKLYDKCGFEKRIPGLTRDMYLSLTHGNLVLPAAYRWMRTIEMDGPTALKIFVELNAGFPIPHPDFATAIDLPRIDGGGKDLWWRWSMFGVTLTQTEMTLGDPPEGVESQQEKVARYKELEEGGKIDKIAKPWAPEGQAWRKKYEENNWLLEMPFPLAIIQADRFTPFSVLATALANLALPGARDFALVAIRKDFTPSGTTERDETIIYHQFKVKLVEPPPPPDAEEDEDDKKGKKKGKKRRGKKKKKKDKEDEEVVEREEGDPPNELRLKVSLDGLTFLEDGKPVETKKCEKATICPTDDARASLKVATKVGTREDAAKYADQARRAFPLHDLFNRASIYKFNGVSDLIIEVEPDVPVEILNAVLMTLSNKVGGVPFKDRNSYLIARKRAKLEPLYDNVFVQVTAVGPIVEIPLTEEEEEEEEEEGEEGDEEEAE